MNAHQNPENILVRCLDRTVFPVRPSDLEPLSCGCYDPYCYSDPEKGRKYMEWSDWTIERNKARGKP